MSLTTPDLLTRCGPFWLSSLFRLFYAWQCKIKSFRGKVSYQAFAVTPGQVHQIRRYLISYLPSGTNQNVQNSSIKSAIWLEIIVKQPNELRNCTLLKIFWQLFKQCESEPIAFLTQSTLRWDLICTIVEDSLVEQAMMFDCSTNRALSKKTDCSARTQETS